MTGLLQFAIRQGAETESYMTSAERIADYAKIETEADTDTGSTSSAPTGTHGVIEVCCL